jgi:protoheme IX farnesyltransferase
MVQSCLVLLVVSLVPTAIGLAGPRYFLIALLLGAVFLTAAVRFLLLPSQERARHVLWASLAYLPVLLTVLLLDGPYLLFA